MRPPVCFSKGLDLNITLTDMIKAFHEADDASKLRFRQMVAIIDEDECDHPSMGEPQTIVKPGLFRCFDCGLLYEQEPEYNITRREAAAPTDIHDQTESTTLNDYFIMLADRSLYDIRKQMRPDGAENLHALLNAVFTTEDENNRLGHVDIAILDKEHLSLLPIDVQNTVSSLLSLMNIENVLLYAWKERDENLFYMEYDGRVEAVPDLMGREEMVPKIDKLLSLCKADSDSISARVCYVPTSSLPNSPSSSDPSTMLMTFNNSKGVEVASVLQLKRVQ